MKKKILAGVIVASMAAVGMVGCGSSSSSTTSSTSTASATSDSSDSDSSDLKTSTESLSGTITLAGSTSMEKLCEAMSESFMEENPGVTVTTEYSGSGAGLESLAAGSVDIGNASRSLKDEEKEEGEVENIVAIDGIAVITDADNTVNDITSEDLAKIYKGEITNWKDLGGEDESIIVLGREAGSGTRSAFEELLEIEDQCNYAQEIDSTGGVLAKVAATPGAIGYVSLDVVDDTVTEVSLDGVEPTEENIVAGDYLLSRPFVMATMGEISEQSDLVQAWFDYIESEVGQEVITGLGLILPQ